MAVDPGDPDAAVLRFVLAVEVNDDAGQPFYNVRVGSRTAIERVRTDPADEFHDLLFGRIIIAADENVSEGRIDVAEIHR